MEKEVTGKMNIGQCELPFAEGPNGGQAEPSGRKSDRGKLRYDLLPVDVLEQIVRVLTAGATKYGDENWKNVEPYKDRYYAAAMRHLVAWRQGEVADREDGLPHLAHALCCIIFILWKDMWRARTPQPMPEEGLTRKMYYDPDTREWRMV